VEAKRRLRALLGVCTFFTSSVIACSTLPLSRRLLTTVAQTVALPGDARKLDYKIFSK
jgi:hypothetical protein